MCNDVYCVHELLHSLFNLILMIIIIIIINTSESDHRSYEATKVDVKNVQKNIRGFNFVWAFFATALAASKLRGSLSLVFSIRSAYI